MGPSPVSDIELDYDSLMQDALKKVVHDVLAITAELRETPGDHHFYIEFLTEADGVQIPDHLKETYPSRMTIVLHHQFEDLIVTETGFGVTLWFKGIEAQLEIPFDAITSFADPGAKFGLRFQEEEEGEENPLPIHNQDQPTTQDITKADNNTDASESLDADDKDNDGNDSGADVVSLDAFRRK